MKRILSILFWSVISAAFIGPGTVTTASLAGNQFGLNLLWALTFSTIACIVLQEASARIALATGKGLGRSIAMSYASIKKGKTVSRVLAAAVVFGCAAYQAGNILGAVAGLQLVIDAPGWLLILIISAVAAGLLFTGSQSLVARFLGGIVAMMGAAFFIIATKADASAPQLIYRAFIPAIPANSAWLTIGLIGTTIVPYNLFLASGLKHEQELLDMRIGIAIAILIGGLVSMAILVAGSTLKGVYSFEALASQFEVLFGSSGSMLLAMGMGAAGFTSSVTAPLAAAITIAGVSDSPAYKPKGRYFNATWLTVLLLGMLAGLIGFKPIPVIIAAQALNGLILPVVAISMYYLINNKQLIPPHLRNSELWNAVTLLIVGISIFLGSINLVKAAYSAVGAGSPDDLLAWLIPLIIATAVTLLVGRPQKKATYQDPFDQP